MNTAVAEVNASSASSSTLPDGSVPMQLACAVLAEEETARVEMLCAVIGDDSLLALWCVGQAFASSQRILHSPNDAASWFDRFGVNVLVDAESMATREIHALECEQIPDWLRGDEVASTLIAASELPRRWQADQPADFAVLQGACRLRLHVRQLEEHWDENFLREKLASLKEFTYGASHELNNPLFNISSRAQSLLRDEQDPERRRKLATIYSHAMRASEMIGDIALAARTPKPQSATLDLISVVQTAIEELRPMAEKQGASLHLECAQDSVMIEADAEQLAVAIGEVCINALESLGRRMRSGTVTVKIVQNSHEVAIAIADDGPGLDERARRHLFDPFFSGYESGRGLGFGLTKCWQIVQAHGGTIEVDSQPNRGTEITIRFPLNK